MVMICLVEGISRPSALARKLRVSRQAMQKTLADLEAKGYLRLEPDPEDRRAKHVRLSKIGMQRQNSAKIYLRNLEKALKTRLGAPTVTALSEALQADWGEPSATERQ